MQPTGTTLSCRQESLLALLEMFDSYAPRSSSSSSPPTPVPNSTPSASLQELLDQCGITVERLQEGNGGGGLWYHYNKLKDKARTAIHGKSDQFLVVILILPLTRSLTRSITHSINQSNNLYQIYRRRNESKRLSIQHKDAVTCMTRLGNLTFQQLTTLPRMHSRHCHHLHPPSINIHPASCLCLRP